MLPNSEVPPELPPNKLLPAFVFVAPAPKFSVGPEVVGFVLPNRPPVAGFAALLPKRPPDVLVLLF